MRNLNIFILALIIFIILILFLFAAIVWFIFSYHRTELNQESEIENEIQQRNLPFNEISEERGQLCGNAIKENEEECDWGDNNSDYKPDFCRSNCKLPYCGDEAVDSDEECDYGRLNSNLPNASCRTNCRYPKCGDGIKDDYYLGEECDDNNYSNNDLCSINCQTQIKEMCWQSDFLVLINDVPYCSQYDSEEKGCIDKENLTDFILTSQQKNQIKKFCQCVSGEYHYYGWDGYCSYDSTQTVVVVNREENGQIPRYEPNPTGPVVPGNPCDEAVFNKFPYSEKKNYIDPIANENYETKVIFSSDYYGKSFWIIEKISCYPDQYSLTTENYWHYKVSQ